MVWQEACRRASLTDVRIGAGVPVMVTVLVAKGHLELVPVGRSNVLSYSSVFGAQQHGWAAASLQRPRPTGDCFQGLDCVKHFSTAAQPGQ